MFRFFCNQRYFLLFFNIENKNIRELSKKYGTVSHLSIVTDQLVKEGLINKIKKGREVEIEITEQGLEFLKLLRKLYNFMILQENKFKKLNSGGI